jgi:chemotaxis protein MotA
MRIRQEQIVREMMLEGVISILEGMNPRMIETKLLGFFAEANKKPAAAKGGEKSAAGAAQEKVA